MKNQKFFSSLKLTVPYTPQKIALNVTMKMILSQTDVLFAGATKWKWVVINMSQEEKLRQRIMEQDEVIVKLKATISDLKKRCQVLLRMSDEWAKSYDRLLKDFIKIRRGF